MNSVRYSAIALAAVVVLNLALYGFTVSSGPCLDDWLWLWLGRVAWNDPATAYGYDVSGFFRPLVTTYWASLSAFGTCDLILHRLGSLLTACALSYGVYRATRVVTGSQVQGIVTSTMFTIHPSHAQVTMWLSARTSALLAVAAIGSVALWWKFLQSNHKRLAWISVAIASLSLLIKEEAVVLFPTLVLLTLLYKSNTGWLLQIKRCRTALITLLIALCAYLALQALLQSSNPLVTQGEFKIDAAAISRMLTRCPHMIAPHNMYALALPTTFTAISILLVGLIRDRNRTLIAWSIAVSIICLAPTSGFETLWFAERYYYLSVISFLISLSLLRATSGA